MEIERYELLASNDNVELGEQVEKAIRNGWQPYGGPIGTHSGTQRYYAQAMVKYAKKPQHLQMPR